jgi:hypothetical protein
MCPLGFETIFDYKPHDPPRVMCRSIHYPFTTKKHVGIETIPGSHLHFTLFIPFQTICYFHLHFQPLTSSTILATYTFKLHFPPSTTNFLDLYLNLHLFHPYYLVASFLPLPHVYNHETFILQWEEENWHQMSHQTLWNQWLNTH